MRLDADAALKRLADGVHGVFCTLHHERGPDPVPVVYAVAPGGYVGVPVDTVKPKTSTRLRREDNLDADPRGALLVERWDADDWSKLWWVRADLHHVTDPAKDLLEELGSRLAGTVPQYADRPFDHLIVCRIVSITGWAASDS
jgi:hypothetical protein